jgi:hypothetical protein
VGKRKPYVVGILSGNEKDGLDPRRYVFGGGGYSSIA